MQLAWALRKPKLHKYLGADNKKGLSNVLGGFDKIEVFVGFYSIKSKGGMIF